MLDDYQTEQPIIYRILKNAILKDKCSHAYLFETNNYRHADAFIKSFVKALLCPEHHMTKPTDCRYCHLIETDNFPEIKVINPDGFWIKKKNYSHFKKNSLKNQLWVTVKSTLLTELIN